MESNLSKFKSPITKSAFNTRRNIPNSNKKLKTKNADLTMFCNPDEDNIHQSIYNTTSFFNETITFRSVIDDGNRTLTGSVIVAQEPWKKTPESLFMEFFEVLLSYSDSNEILQVVAEMSRCCTDAVNVVRGLKSKVAAKTNDEEVWLENERNTWRLLYVLYGNRLNTPTNEDDDMCIYTGPSEKYCMLSLFKRDSLVRESQLVIDWLEANAAQKDDEILNFSDNTIGWENTLHQLKSKETVVFESSRPIVKEIHPDAPHLERKPLHDLDVEDDKRLCQKVFQEIRCGKLEEAQKLCALCGHSWRAAQLEGWKLYHNPNLEDKFSEEFEDKLNPNNMEGDEKYKDIEGNESRSIWKAMAWKYCNVGSLNNFEKASIAAYCGNLETLLNVCNTWEDHLWAYMKVMIDIRVESEIRENVNVIYHHLPEGYWDQKMSINDIFACLEASKNPSIQKEALTPDHQIQKFIILDEINRLVECIADWILEPDVSAQFLRFLTHLLMFLEYIGQVHNKEIVEQVIEEYIKKLVEMRQTQLIAFYVSKLNENMQLHIYSNYLETIFNNDERKEALTFAEDCGLNVLTISKQVVENIRRKHDITPIGNLQHHMTELDEQKISAIDWLLFYEYQYPDTLCQTNALISLFLTLHKIDAARLAFNKLPIDIIKKLSIEGEIPDNLKQAVKEHLSYKMYLDAQEAFSDWFRYYENKLAPPEKPSENAAFTEKVAYEHRISQYEADTIRWKLSIEQLAKVAKSYLYNVLLFPNGGWLSGAQDADYLRSTYIPECVTLLYDVLYKSDQFEECIQLADILASEKYKLYSVYTPEKLENVAKMLNEASMALLDNKKDPWGHELSA